MYPSRAFLRRLNQSFAIMLGLIFINAILAFSQTSSLWPLNAIAIAVVGFFCAANRAAYRMLKEQLEQETDGRR